MANTYRITIQTSLDVGGLRSGQTQASNIFDRIIKDAEKAGAKIDKAFGKSSGGGTSKGFGPDRWMQDQLRAIEQANRAEEKARQRNHAEAQRINRAKEQEAQRSARAEEQAASRVARTKAREAERAARDVARIQAQTRRQAEQQARFLERTETQLANHRIREAQRAARAQANTYLQAQRGGGIGPGGGGGLSSVFGVAALGGAIGGALGISIGTITSTLQQGARAWIDYASKIQNSRIAFETMLGSAGKAEAHLKELQKFALETPFAFDELVDASQRMQALGFQAEEVVPLLRDVGNAVAAVGGGSERLERVIKALSDVRAKGKLQSQEIRQFAEAGISVYQILHEATGKTTQEIVKMTEAGQISSELFISAFQKFSQIHFGDMMEKQSRTFTGAMSNIRDVLLQVSAKAFEPLFGKISEIAVRVQAELQKAKNLDEVASVLADAFGELGGYLATALAEALGRRLASPEFWMRYISALPETLNSVLRGIVKQIYDRARPEYAEFNELTPRGEPLDYVIKKDAIPIQKLLEDPTKVGKVAQGRPSGAIALDQMSESGKKAREMYMDLAREVELFGDKSAVTAAKQKLLEMEIDLTSSKLDDETRAFGEGVMKMAARLDALKKNKEATEAGEAALERSKELYRDLGIQLDHFNKEETKVRSVTQQIADIKTEKLLPAMKLEVERYKELALARAAELDAKAAEAKREKEKQDAVETVSKAIEQYKQKTYELTESQKEGTQAAVAYNLFLAQHKDAALAGKAALEQLRIAVEDYFASVNRDRVKKLRTDTENALKDFDIQIRGLQEGREETRLDRLVQSLIQLQGLKLKPDAFAPLIELSEAAAKGDTRAAQELLGQLSTLLAGASGEGIDPSKIDATVVALQKLLITTAQLSTPSGEAFASLKRELKESQNEIGIASETAALRAQIAWQNAFNEIVLSDQVAREEMIASQLYIADQTIFHTDRARARVMDFFARQRGITETFADAFIRAAESTGDAIERAIGKITKQFGVFGDIIKGILSDLARLAINRVFGRLLDVLLPPSGGGGGFGAPAFAGAGASGSGGGGFMGVAGSLLGSFLGGGRGGAPSFLTGGFAGGPGGAQFLFGGGGGVTGPGAGTSSWAAQLFGAGPATPLSFQGAAGMPAWTKTGLGAGLNLPLKGGGITAALRGMLPMLGLTTGLGLGSSLGGPSRLGQVLGGIGGGALGLSAGLAGFLALGGSLGTGTLAGIGTAIAGALPIIAPIAAVLLIGSYFLGKAKQRKKDEQARDALKGDVMKQLDDMIKQAGKGQLGDADAARATAQALVDQYYQQVATLKTKSVRQSAENFRPYFKAKVDAIAAAASKAQVEADFSARFSPTYAAGGRVERALGLMPGVFDARDDVLVRRSRGETILNPAHVARLGGSSAMVAAGVPGYAPKGSYSGGGNVSTSAKPGDQVYVLAIGDAQIAEIGRRIPGAIVIDLAANEVDSGRGTRLVAGVTKKQRQGGYGR